jgi:hypothetical protein
VTYTNQEKEIKMPKYIDADDFFSVFGELDKEPYNTFNQIETDSLEEVIYCKDCVKEQICKFAQYQGIYGFCSLAERKEDE